VQAYWVLMPCKLNTKIGAVLFCSRFSPQQLLFCLQRLFDMRGSTTK